jgi:hypothetical protein
MQQQHVKDTATSQPACAHRPDSQAQGNQTSGATSNMRVCEVTSHSRGYHTWCHTHCRGTQYFRCHPSIMHDSTHGHCISTRLCAKRSAAALYPILAQQAPHPEPCSCSEPNPSASVRLAEGYPASIQRRKAAAQGPHSGAQTTSKHSDLTSRPVCLVETGRRHFPKSQFALCIQSGWQ